MVLREGMNRLVTQWIRLHSHLEALSRQRSVVRCLVNVALEEVCGAGGLRRGKWVLVGVLVGIMVSLPMREIVRVVGSREHHAFCRW